MKQNKKPTKQAEQTDYEEALKNLKTASVRMELRRHGIDPFEFSMKDFDEIRRLYQRMEQVDATANGRITAIQQEAYQEKTVIGQEISERIKKLIQEQNPMPPLPELHLDTDQVEVEAEAEAEAGQQALQEPTGQEEVSGKEPGKEQVDKEVQGGSGDTGAGGVGEDRSDSEPIKPE